MKRSLDKDIHILQEFRVAYTLKKALCKEQDFNLFEEIYNRETF